MKKKNLLVSFIIPSYNERENIMKIIPSIASYFEQKKISAELIVVDDSSPDGTGKEVDLLSKKYKNLRLIVPPLRKGIGNALALGYSSAQGEYLLSMDADLDYQPLVIDSMLQKMDGGLDFVVASKYHPQSSLFRASLRENIQTIISRGGAIYMTLITRAPVNDFSMNFRILRKKVWDTLSVSDTKNFFLAECIFQAHQKGYKLGEIPFTFNPRKFGVSKTSLWSQAAVFLVGTWKYRFWKQLQGK